ncbi:hypothetical protein [Burkholderia ubonensis]|uniref:hypothetical protein n=1 Tax=Burkholderia ubonensis TaxID=101571 RepID=UPI00075D9E41|nr:hypothetical protein [Burkholderia ubonensis]KVP29313.1 hypothetical protein WJ88_14230 [Burkholderia ubonensis]
MALRILRPDELDDAELLRRNRLTMLRYLAGSAYECCDAFAPDILGACRDGLTLGQLEQRLAPLDPTVSRTAAFKLVLRAAPCIVRRSLRSRWDCAAYKLACREGNDPVAAWFAYKKEQARGIRVTPMISRAC